MKSFKVCLHELRGMVRPVRLQILVSVLIGVLRIAASLLFVWTSKALVDIATGKSDAELRSYVICMVAIILVQIVSGLSASYWENYIVLKNTNAMRYRYFEHVLSSVWNGRESFHSGDLVNRITEDVRVMVDLLCTRIPDIIVTATQLAAASVFLFILAPNLLWILIGLMAVAIIGSRLFFGKLRRLTEVIREKESLAQQHIQESLQNRVLVLTLTGTEKVLSKLGFIQKEIQDNTVTRLNYNATARGFMGLGFMSGYAAAFLWGVFGIRSGAVTFGMMTAFLQLVGQVQRPIADLARHVPAFIHSLTSIERLGDLMDMPLEEKGQPLFCPHAPEIKVSGMTFAYPDQDSPVLKDFSYTFESGLMTEVAGPTGIGKSTLVRLVLALLKPQEGEILIDGTPVSADTRCNFMYVPQGNSLISGTIRDNLMLAGGPSEEQMKEALHIAVADFVLDLPDGLDSRCGESGSGLSEGQSQRIAIARALLCRGNVLILDESTSALDPATEQQLLSNLRDYTAGRKTVIFISHRESVARVCDRILNI